MFLPRLPSLKNLFPVLILILMELAANDVFALNSYTYKTSRPEVHIFAQQDKQKLRQKSSQLVNLARQLKQKHHKERVLFIGIVLDELIYLHHSEAKKARLLAEDDVQERDKLVRWSLKSLAFSNRLEGIRRHLSLLSSIQVFSEGFGELSFIIDGKPVLVNSPLIRQQGDMEERIVVAVCHQISCDQKQLNAIYEQKNYRLVVRAGWSLQENGDTFYETKRGLHFVFNDLDNKLQKERISRFIARDLNLISDAIIQAHKMGVFIDWEYLYVNSEGGSDKKYQLIVNQFRDSIDLELIAIPYLNDYPQLMIPWLKARLKKETVHFYIHDAETIVSELMHII